MPLIKSLNKVNKKLSKQSSGSLHVKGRKFKQLNRATERESKIKMKKAQYAEQKNHELLFYLHIQEKANEAGAKNTYDEDEIRAFVREYVHRSDDDILQMDKERRPGRPMTNKHQIMVEKRKHDLHLFDTGYRTPDIRDELTCQRVKNWNGTSGAVSAWKFFLVSETDSDKVTDNMD